MEERGTPRYSRTLSSERSYSHSLGPYLSSHHHLQSKQHLHQENVSFFTPYCRGRDLTSTECLTGVGHTSSDKENTSPLPLPSTAAEPAAHVSGNRNLEVHDAAGEPLARGLESDSGSPLILLCRDTNGCLEYLLWAPTWISEEDVARVAPKQLKQYKKMLNIRPASRESQVRKRAAPPDPQCRRSSRLKKPRRW